MERYPAKLYDWLNRRLTADLELWKRLAGECRGEVLELGCGTGRVLLEVARQGHAVTGLDLDPGMLKELRRKLKAEPREIRARVTLATGDMRDFRLGRRFGLAYVPFNAFLHLLTPEDQERALLAIRRHLRPGGRLALVVFDPSYESLGERDHGSFLGVPTRAHSDVVDPTSGERLLVSTVRRTLDYERHVLSELWSFERFGKDGRPIDRFLWPLVLRWTFPQEFRYLFRLTGFEVESLAGGYRGEPFLHGAMQVWTVRRPGR